MKRIKLISMVVVLALLLGMAHYVALGKETPMLSVADDIRWTTYTDPRFGFTIEYPANWYVRPRDDSHGVSATLAFSNLHPQRDSGEKLIKVEIGVYLVEWLADLSLEQWAARYDAAATAFKSSEINIESVRQVEVGEQDALRKEGVSPLTEFKYVNVPWGRTMWFVWSNSDDVHAAIYDHMVASFQFGKETPRTLQEIYGEKFQPPPLDEVSAEVASASTRAPGLAKLLAAVSTSWWVPVRGYQGMGCNSDNHTNGADHAVDIDVGEGTDVYASQPVEYKVFLGWDNTGYGNLVKMKYQSGGTYVSYYAHLQSIDYDNIVFTPPYWGLYRGSHLGKSGNTGNSTGPHLHFHIQDGIGQSTSNGVDLTGMKGFYPDGDYPDCCVCGYVSF